MPRPRKPAYTANEVHRLRSETMLTAMALAHTLHSTEPRSGLWAALAYESMLFAHPHLAAQRLSPTKLSALLTFP